jgi:hypothetical protein
VSPSPFGIFAAFPNEAGRQTHLAVLVAAALMAKTSELLAKPPAIQKNRGAGSQASGLT